MQMQQSINFPLALKKLDDNRYPSDDLIDFVEKAGVSQILSKYQAGVRLTKKLIEQILENDKLFQKILFVETPEDLQKLVDLYHAKQDFRMMIAQALETHFRGVARYLNKLYEKDNGGQAFIMQLEIFMSFLNDPEAGIGLRAAKAISKMLNKELLKQCLQCDRLYDLIMTGMKHEDDVIRMRYMEVAMEVSNSNVEAHEKLVEKGILDICMEQTCTKDILLRLSAVEVISKIGNKAYNAKYLSTHPRMKTIIHDAFNPLEELYVKKYLAVLLSKLIANKSMEFTVQLKQQFLDLLVQLFFKGMEEEKYAAIDIISYLAHTMDGIKLILLEKQVFAAYMSLSQSTKQPIRQRFYSSLSSFFYKNPVEQKNGKALSNILICFGNLEKINHITDFYQPPQSLEDLQPAMDSIFKTLYEPFQEMEIEMLNLVKSIIQWEVICKWFIGHSKSIYYLTEHYAKSGEIYSQKQELIQQILDLCNNEFSKEHVVFKQFAQKLTQRIQELKNQQKDKNNKQGEMEYGLENA